MTTPLRFVRYFRFILLLIAYWGFGLGLAYAEEGQYLPLSEDAIIKKLRMPLHSLLRKKKYSIEEIIKSDEIRKYLPSVVFDSSFIHFRLNSAKVIGHSKRQIEIMGSAMRKLLARNPHEIFLLAGHTDKLGTSRYNMRLSKKRVIEVKRILSVDYGVPKQSLYIGWYGERFPVIQTNGSSQMNRRVTLYSLTAALHLQLVNSVSRVVITKRSHFEKKELHSTDKNPTVMAEANYYPTGDGNWKSLGSDDQENTSYRNRCQTRSGHSKINITLKGFSNHELTRSLGGFWLSLGGYQKYRLVEARPLYRHIFITITNTSCLPLNQITQIFKRRGFSVNDQILLYKRRGKIFIEKLN